ncbi:hypothetical protein BJX66DRAFT_218364 [Aspergillus keveii]|uniref:Uncharacterized protein n=1 Tax=Aspergillus keveii TaxID=714993 RepID=A0ABR4G4C2_9EURO
MSRSRGTDRSSLSEKGYLRAITTILINFVTKRPMERGDNYIKKIDNHNYYSGGGPEPTTGLVRLKFKKRRSAPKSDEPFQQHAFFTSAPLASQLIFHCQLGEPTSAITRYSDPPDDCLGTGTRLYGTSLFPRPYVVSLSPGDATTRTYRPSIRESLTPFFQFHPQVALSTSVPFMCRDPDGGKPQSSFQG